MDRRRLTVSLVAALAAACLYYRGGLLLLPITVLPVAAHELSHLLMLLLLGKRITDFSLDARGFCILYEGTCTEYGHILAALAGPLGGALYALAADRTGIVWLRQSAGVSLLLTAFNLLPILPLDGGRVFCQLCVILLGEGRGRRLFRGVSKVLLALFLLGGVILALWQKSTAPLAAGIWLLLFQNDREILANIEKIG